MPETYDVRQRTFIKVPEVKHCAACGQPLPSDVKPFNNHMSRYVSVEGVVSVMNSNEDSIEIKQGNAVVKLYKVTGKDPLTNKEISSFLPPTPKPSTPTK